MTLAIDVFWSFRSPYSYLATPRLVALAHDYDLQVNVRVVLPIAVAAGGTTVVTPGPWYPPALPCTSSVGRHQRRSIASIALAARTERKP